MIVAVTAHEIDACGARRYTVEHQLNVRMLGMFATLQQTVAGQHVSAGDLTLLAILNALLHGCSCAVHFFLIFVSSVPAPNQQTFGSANCIPMWGLIETTYLQPTAEKNPWITSRELYNQGQTNLPGIRSANVALRQRRLDLLNAENEYAEAFRQFASVIGCNTIPFIFMFTRSG